MADYTSYSTSVALRDAGAPQTGDLATYWCDGFSTPCVHSHCILSHNGTTETIHHPRAFRADEIIEAIRADGAHAVDIEDDDEWVVRIYSYGVCRRPYEHESLVEALAAAWLAVLKEEGR